MALCKFLWERVTGECDRVSSCKVQRGPTAASPSSISHLKSCSFLPVRFQVPVKSSGSVPHRCIECEHCLLRPPLPFCLDYADSLRVPHTVVRLQVCPATPSFLSGRWIFELCSSQPYSMGSYPLSHLPSSQGTDS